MTLTNNRLVTSAHTYIESAIHHLEYLKDTRDGTLNYGQLCDVKSALSSLKMSRSLLKKTTFNHVGKCKALSEHHQKSQSDFRDKDKYTRRMKP